MKIYKSLITPVKPLRIDEDVSFEPSRFQNSYPLLGIEKAHIRGFIEKNGDFLTANIEVNATMVLSDSFTSKPFEEAFSQKEVADIMSSYEEEGEGYVFEDNCFELEELVFQLIRSYVPIQPLSPSSKKKATERKEEDDQFNPAFDALKDWDFNK